MRRHDQTVGHVIVSAVRSSRASESETSRIVDLDVWFTLIETATSNLQRRCLLSRSVLFRTLLRSKMS